MGKNCGGFFFKEKEKIIYNSITFIFKYKGPLYNNYTCIMFHKTNCIWDGITTLNKKTDTLYWNHKLNGPPTLTALINDETSIAHFG